MDVSIMRYRWAALCITVLLMSESLKGMSLGETDGNNEPTNPSFNYKLTMDITNQIYTDSLLNQESPDYEILFSQVSGALYSIYGCITCSTHQFYQGASAMTFGNESGSVLVEATLTFQSNQINADVILNLFIHATAGSNNINGLEINPKFTNAILGTTPAPHHTTARPVIDRTTHPITNTTGTITIHPPKTTTTTTTTHRSINPSETTHTTTTTRPTTTPTTRPTTTTTTRPTTTTTTRPTTKTTPRPTTKSTTRPTTTTTTRPTTKTTPRPTTKSTTRPTTTTTTRPTTKTTPRPTTKTTPRPTTTTTTRPTTTTTTRPTTTTTTRPTTTTTKTTHHNAASSFFHQSPISLTSFLRFSVSLGLFFLVNFSF